jgi:hypothetical protein
MANVVALAFVDTDSNPDQREPFFKNLDEVLSLDGELIQYLHARADAWQQECSPTRAKLSGTEFVDMLVKLVEQNTDDTPFFTLRPGLQLNCLRSTAGLLLSLPEGRSRLLSLYAPTSLSDSKANAQIVPS